MCLQALNKCAGINGKILNFGTDPNIFPYKQKGQKIFPQTKSGLQPQTIIVFTSAITKDEKDLKECKRISAGFKRDNFGIITITQQTRTLFRKPSTLFRILGKIWKSL